MNMNFTSGNYRVEWIARGDRMSFDVSMRVDGEWWSMLPEPTPTTLPVTTPWETLHDGMTYIMTAVYGRQYITRQTDALSQASPEWWSAPVADWAILA